MKLLIHLLVISLSLSWIKCGTGAAIELDPCMPHDRSRACPISSPPVLGISSNLDAYFFYNKCRACRNYFVRSVIPVEECPDANSDYECTEEIVCAITDNNQLKEYDSDCKACEDIEVRYILRSRCPKNLVY